MSTNFEKDVGIRHIAVPRTGEDLFATGESKKKVTVWSFQARTRICNLATILDFGGPRLGLTCNGKPMVVAGSWNKGAAGYEDTSGQILWTRPDLKNIRQIRDLSDRNSLLVGVGLDEGAYQIVKAETGETQLQLVGIKKIYASPFAPLYLLNSSDKAVLLSAEFRLPAIWRRPAVSFAILHAAFSPEQVAYSEADGAVYCVDFYGIDVWRFQPEPGHHILEIGWDSERHRWLAISWHFHRGGPKLLIEIDSGGNSRVVANLGHCLEAEFFLSGSHIITSNGEVVSTQSGESVWKFAQPDSTPVDNAV